MPSPGEFKRYAEKKAAKLQFAKDMEQLKKRKARAKSKVKSVVLSVNKPYAKSRAPRSAAHPLATHAKYVAGYSNSHILPVPNTLGKFTPLNVITRATQSSLIAGNNFVVVQFTNSSYNCFLINGLTRQVGFLNAGQLQATPPQQIRQLKMSIEVCNTTVFTSVQGSCRTLMIGNMIPWSWDTVNTATLTQACVDVINNLMDSHPDTVTHSSMDLVKSKTFISSAAGYQAFSAYYDFNSLTSVQGLQQALSMADVSITPANGSTTYFGPPPPVSTVFILEIRPVAVTNSYDIAVKQQVACKYAADNILSNMAIDPPIISSTAFAAENTKVNTGSSQGHDTATLAIHANKAASTIQSAYRNSRIRGANRQVM